MRVTTELMTMFGGTAFAGRLPFERYFLMMPGLAYGWDWLTTWP